MPLVLIANQYGGKVLRSPLRARFDTQGGTLGRSSTNHLVLPDSNHHVSRVHAAIRCENGFFLLEVQGQNPVEINRKALRTGQSRRLTAGDEIAIGPYRISVAIEHEGDLAGAAPEDLPRSPIITTSGSQPVTIGGAERTRDPDSMYFARDAEHAARHEDVTPGTGGEPQRKAPMAESPLDMSAADPVLSTPAASLTTSTASNSSTSANPSISSAPSTLSMPSPPSTPSAPSTTSTASNPTSSSNPSASSNPSTSSNSSNASHPSTSSSRTTASPSSGSPPPPETIESERREPTYFIPDATLFSRGPKEPGGRIATDITLQTRFSIPIKTEEKTNDPAPEPQLRTSVQDASVNETMVRRISWADDAAVPATTADARDSDQTPAQPPDKDRDARPHDSTPPGPLGIGMTTVWGDATGTLFVKPASVPAEAAPAREDHPPGLPRSEPAARVESAPAQEDHPPTAARIDDEANDSARDPVAATPAAPAPQTGTQRTDPVFIIPDATLFSRGPKEPKAGIATDIALQTSLRLPIVDGKPAATPQKEPKLFTSVQDAQVAETMMRRIDWADTRLNQPVSPAGEPAMPPPERTPVTPALPEAAAPAATEPGHASGATVHLQVPAVAPASPVPVSAEPGVKETFAEALVRGLGLDPAAQGNPWSPALGFALGTHIKSLLASQAPDSGQDAVTALIERLARARGEAAPPADSPD